MSGKISTRFGYGAIYGSAGVLQFLALTYAIFFVKESTDIRDYKGMTSDSSTNVDKAAADSEKRIPSCQSIFSTMAQSFGVAFQKRDGGLRHIVIILIALFGLYGFANNGISSINIQYARARFTWEDGSDDFNEWWASLQSIGTVFNLFAIGVLMPIMTQVLKLKDLTIVSFCILSSLAGIMTFLIAKVAVLLYLANFLRMFSDVVTVGIRSTLTKIVGQQDVGKVREE